ncbi:NADH-ubiquinone oxidoreductase chain 5-like 5, partial [Homarus americanus]
MLTVLSNRVGDAAILFKISLMFIAGGCHGASYPSVCYSSFFYLGYRRIPLTRICINLTNLILCGIPFLAGFYSKDLILEVAFIRNINLLAFILYALATGLTVCYRFLSSLSQFNGLKTAGTRINVGDYGWSEYFGSRGLYSSVIHQSGYLQVSQSN